MVVKRTNSFELGIEESKAKSLTKALDGVIELLIHTTLEHSLPLNFQLYGIIFLLKPVEVKILPSHYITLHYITLQDLETLHTMELG